MEFAIGVRVPLGTEMWDWTLVNNKPVTHFDDQGLVDLIKTHFPQFITKFGEINSRCKNNHFNSTMFWLSELNRARAFVKQREKYSIHGPYDYEETELNIHISNQAALSNLRLENYTPWRGESILVSRIADVFGDGVIVIPQAYLSNFVIDMDVLMTELRDVSDRFRAMNNETWQKFVDEYSNNNSVDILVCLRYCGEIIPVLGIEVDGGGEGGQAGWIENGLYVGGTRDKASAWNMNNKLAVMNAIGLECIVVSRNLVFENGGRLRFTRHGIVEIDPIIEIISSILCDYAGNLLRLPTNYKDTITPTVIEKFRKYPKDDEKMKLIAKVLPALTHVRGAIEAGLRWEEYIPTNMEDLNEWYNQRVHLVSPTTQATVEFIQSNNQMYPVLCLDCHYNGHIVSQISPIHPYESNLRNLVQLQKYPSLLNMVVDACLHFEITEYVL